MINESGRTMAGVISELKQEAKDFLQTRLDMLRSEMRSTVKAWKTTLPMIVIGVVLLASAWILLTWALVSIIAYAFGTGPLAWFFAFLIVGFAYSVGGAICAAVAFRELRGNEVLPRRTLRVLKEDQLWLQSEARTQL